MNSDSVLPEKINNSEKKQTATFIQRVLTSNFALDLNSFTFITDGTTSKKGMNISLTIWWLHCGDWYFYSFKLEAEASCADTAWE